MKFVLSVVDSLDPCRHLLYTFQDVLSHHSIAVSEVTAASHTGPSIECTIDQLGLSRRLWRCHFLSDFQKESIHV